jgi:hypothetical protein
MASRRTFKESGSSAIIRRAKGAILCGHKKGDSEGKRWASSGGGKKWSCRADPACVCSWGRVVVRRTAMSHPGDGQQRSTVSPPQAAVLVAATPESLHWQLRGSRADSFLKGSHIFRGVPSSHQPFVWEILVGGVYSFDGTGNSGPQAC